MHHTKAVDLSRFGNVIFGPWVQHHKKYMNSEDLAIFFLHTISKPQIRFSITKLKILAAFCVKMMQEKNLIVPFSLKDCSQLLKVSPNVIQSSMSRLVKDQLLVSIQSFSSRKQKIYEMHPHLFENWSSNKQEDEANRILLLCFFEFIYKLSKKDPVIYVQILSVFITYTVLLKSPKSEITAFELTEILHKSFDYIEKKLQELTFIKVLDKVKVLRDHQEMTAYTLNRSIF